MTRINKGDTFPVFEFSTAYEDGLNSKEVLKGKTIFWVLRYIGCTVCRYDVHLIAQRYDEFRQKGAQVFVVMQSDQEHIRRDLEATNTVLPFSIICDPKQEIYQLLDIKAAATKEEMVEGVMDKLKEKGGKAREAGFVHGDYEGNELQLPAMFIIGQDGIVQKAIYAETIMGLPNLNELLEMI